MKIIVSNGKIIIEATPIEFSGITGLVKLGNQVSYCANPPGKCHTCDLRVYLAGTIATANEDNWKRHNDELDKFFQDSNPNYKS